MACLLSYLYSYISPFIMYSLIQLEVIQSAITRLENIIGGHQFSGKGVLPGGLLEEGTYSVLGPIYFFSSPEHNASGIATRNSAPLNPPQSAWAKNWMCSYQSFPRTGRETFPSM